MAYSLLKSQSSHAIQAEYRVLNAVNWQKEGQNFIIMPY